MKISGTHYRTIWPTGTGSVRVIDQSRLPFEFATIDLDSLEDAAAAIRTMVVRGAPLIGATAAYGLALALRSNPSDAQIEHAAQSLKATRPTAHNLAWALTRMRRALAEVALPDRVDAAFRAAALICDEDVEQCRAIGAHGLELVRRAAGTLQRPLNILTHCNAGWLACVDWGTALAPVYMAYDAGIAVHVWVDETRPRNQGAALTAFELGAHGIPHTVIADNLGGHLMQRGQVDLVLVGSDRTTSTGDVSQQDRHLPQGAGRSRQWRALLCGIADEHDRLVPRPRQRDPDRGALADGAHACHRQSSLRRSRVGAGGA